MSAVGNSARTGNARSRAARRPATYVRIVVLVLLVLACAGPLVYGALLSFRPLPQVIAHPFRLLPSPAQGFSAYAAVLRSTAHDGYGLANGMRNSLIVSVATTVFAIAGSVLGAYAVSRLRFLGRSTLSGVFVGIYLLPGIVMAVPLFVLFSRLGLIGTLPGLVIIYLAQTVPVSLYMLRNYFDAIPESIEEAALVDGCSRMGVVGRIVLPLARPGIAATALYIFMIAWNEYLFALLFVVQDRSRWTVSLTIAQLTTFDTPLPELMAAAMVITVPILVAFYVSQRFLVSGLTAGASKE